MKKYLINENYFVGGITDDLYENTFQCIIMVKKSLGKLVPKKNWTKY